MDIYQVIMIYLGSLILKTCSDAAIFVSVAAETRRQQLIALHYDCTVYLLLQ